MRRLKMRCGLSVTGCMAQGAELVGMVCEDRADCAADAVCLARATRQRRRGELFVRIAIRERDSVGSYRLRCCFGVDSRAINWEGFLANQVESQLRLVVSIPRPAGRPKQTSKKCCAWSSGNETELRSSCTRSNSLPIDRRICSAFAVLMAVCPFRLARLRTLGTHRHLSTVTNTRCVRQ